LYGGSLKKSRRSKRDEKWLKAIGVHIHKLILEKGYKSPYDFWINKIGDEISRATLNYILTGKVDVKATTLNKIAEGLRVEPKELLNFKYSSTKV
jgi:DNA-binding Xre family transcriptional regulator